MNIPNLNVKILIILSAILAIIFLLTLLVTAKKKNQTIDNGNSTLPIPTKVEPPKSQTSINIKPTTTPAAFTGVKEEPIPTEIVNLVNQKQELRRKLPLNLLNFYIDFDYTQDKFIVNLSDPKDQTQKEFQDWRQTNYPAIDLDQFIIK